MYIGILIEKGNQIGTPELGKKIPLKNVKHAVQQKKLRGHGNMKKAILAVAVAAVIGTGCANATKQEQGALAGAVLGAGGAYGLADNSSNKELWIVAGTLLGALAGQAIGERLDERDRLLAGQSFQKSMELSPDATSVGWSNPNTGNSGTVTPVSTTVASSGQPCREFSQTIIVGGKEEQAYGTACRMADGSWDIQ